jgi:hypothetical protein
MNFKHILQNYHNEGIQIQFPYQSKSIPATATTCELLGALWSPQNRVAWSNFLPVS